MNHLIICREYSPAPYPAGGIGTYAKHMACLLAEAGETVHMIAQHWEGAPRRIVTSHDGRLIVHRISLEEPIYPAPGEEAAEAKTLRLLAGSDCPSQLFSWQAARYAERLIESEPIDIIEAQEWEAPLYYLQVRRALGLGPSRRPPCIVHLHSPSQMIFQFNEWDQTLTDVQPLLRFEEFSIRNADALLCPSHYLAQGVANLFDLDASRIEVIPYPMGIETPVLERKPEVWARNAICFVGRLELRKGVVEWVDAAIQIASTEPSNLHPVSFDFFGSDTSLSGGMGASVLQSLRRRIPRALRHRFCFHGSRTRDQLLRALAQVAVAVVPSRWENFPFTCIEAMSTGLPILASPNGGMAEMIVDNESGWIAADATADGLADALRRVLATTPAQRAAMGRRAAESIRQLCGNVSIVARQIAFRRQVAATPTVKRLPTSVPGITLHAMGGALLHPETGAATSAAFARNPRLGLLVPWVLYNGRRPWIDTGPVSAALSGPLPPYSIIRADLGRSPCWDSLTGANLMAVTYPAAFVTLSPPSDRDSYPRPRWRYSGMALIQSRSAQFALRWFLAAPLGEKLRWLARIAVNPRRLLQWLASRIRLLVTGSV
jgi:glycosyltransferase involved in cell wall biosynthesis